MKVYTKIVYDKDDNIIEEQSYDYNGPVSQTKKSLQQLLKSDKYKKHKAKIEEMKKIAILIHQVIQNIDNEDVISKVRQEVRQLCASFPLYDKVSA